MSDINDQSSERHLLYFADPMCSWCYGFLPVISALADEFQDSLSLRVVMGGLRAGNTQAMRPQDREYIRSAWTNVGEASGQPFDFSFFDRDTFVYDTEPACRAVVVTRHRYYCCISAIWPIMALTWASWISRWLSLVAMRW